MKSQYKPIKGIGTGRGRPAAIRVRLYEGPDHLLLVYSAGYTEDYKRVFYRDIRYAIARKDRGQVWQGILSGCCILAACLLFLMPVPWMVTAILWLIISLPFLFHFAGNLFLGPTCRIYLNTDVQTVELPVPRRLGRLPKLVAFLNTKISPEQPKVEQAVT
ncbi:MAG TPA: hypothetical protein VL981_14480 [Candidatus Methylacidiphilales bacterium]|nr:hypothetical protein [Candidatus Methylacidiphilales bacterium]